MFYLMLVNIENEESLLKIYLCEIWSNIEIRRKDNKTFQNFFYNFLLLLFYITYKNRFF